KAPADGVAGPIGAERTSVVVVRVVRTCGQPLKPLSGRIELRRRLGGAGLDLRDFVLFLANVHDALVEAVHRRGTRGRGLESLDLLLQERDLDIAFPDFDLRFSKMLAQELHLLQSARAQ